MIYGTIGFVIGLAVALLVVLFIWMLRLAKGIAGRIEEEPPRSEGILKP